MAVTIAEKAESRAASQGDQNSVELQFTVMGAADEAEALAALTAQAPTAWNGLVRKNCRVEPVGDGSSCWNGTVTYGGATASKQEGSKSLSFDTTGGTQHITQAKEHVSTTYYEGDTPPNFQGAIGVTDDSVEGCDITVPVFSFSVTKYLSKAAMTSTYVGYLFTLTGKTNSAQVSITVNGLTLTFAAGELLFLGASGSARGDDSWEVTFRFAASPNATNLSIGGLTGIAKKGWEYMWVQYKDAKDTGAKCVLKKPKRVIVDRVYDSGDLSLLGC
ncbi:MAG: hypothetical protein NT049_16545 [Planctomycetota bacterium]|nr:hypothetical protein [Planctomycetota bacterium]